MNSFARARYIYLERREKGRMLKDLANELGISSQRVAQIEKWADRWIEIKLPKRRR